MEEQLPETTTIAAAVIESGGRYLLMKRATHKGNGGMWEFPGGKVKLGESLQQAVVREVQEELNLKASTGKLLGSAETHDQNRVLRLFGIETFIEHEPRDLKDHSEFLWVLPEDLSKFPMTPAEYGLLSNLKNILNEEKEVASVSVWSLAMLSAVIHGIFGIFAGAFFLTATMAWTGALSSSAKIIGALLMPFFNVLVGLIIGASVAFIYNLYATVFGGIKVKVR